MITQPATHRADELPLPPPPALVSKEPTLQGVLTDAGSALLSWINDRESSFALLMGDFGAGKTTALRRLADHPAASRSTYTTYERLAQAQPAPENQYGHILLIDGFEAINLLNGSQLSAPDLRQLADMLSSYYKVLVATRRNLRLQDDELIRQMTKQARYEKFGVRSPHFITLQPWDIDTLVAAAESSDNDVLRKVCHYLSTEKRIATFQLRRPLLINMPMAISEHLQEHGLLPIAQIYVEYIDTVLSSDYDNGRSLLNGARKSWILSEVAFDIFTGIERDTQPSPDIDSVSYNRIAARVMQLVTEDTLLQTGTPNLRYEWTHDFMITNHFLVERRIGPHPVAFRDRTFVFVHDSFFEYFAAQAIVRRFAGGHSLGLRPGQFSQAIFDSLAIYFVKSFLSPELLTAIMHLAERPRLSWPDRLLTLYLLEDHEAFVATLKGAPAEYIANLREAVDGIESFFLQKIIWYQLVILDLFSAYDYVHLARQREEDSDVGLELLTQSGETGVSQFLVKRLNNPGLARARPITIYRLGQLGDSSSLPQLEEVSRAAEESQLRHLANEACERIKARSAAARLSMTAKGA